MCSQHCLTFERKAICLLSPFEDLLLNVSPIFKTASIFTLMDLCATRLSHQRERFPSLRMNDCSAKINISTSSTTAELSVIQMTLQHPLPLVDPIPAVIFTDSRSSLVQLSNLDWATPFLHLQHVTSSALVLAEGREPRLAVLRQQDTHRHFFRLTTQHNEHPPRMLLTRSESFLHRVLTSSEAQLLLYNYWEPDITCALWLLPSPPANADVPRLHCRINYTPLVAAQLTLCYLYDSYEQNIRIVTDGSMRNDDSTSAFVILELRESHYYRLSVRSTTTAELHPILYAVNRMVSDTVLTSQCNRWVICTDSISAQELLKSMNQRSPVFIFAHNLLHAT